MTNIQFVLRGTLLAEHGTRFRVRTHVWSLGNAGSDPTTTAKVSLYQATIAAATTGFTATLGSEVASSAISGLAPTPRGTIVNGESSDFTIDPSKVYVPVVELLTANLPASTSFTSYVDIIAID
ncbi:hypothetical protein [Capillimicrobium parvum]|uniref:hypothetical protein n=1 Tax=Capillimicrobium parvum TaxID=2884022 RepID=UPI00216B078A|nr:hypothetical protein [Capillimicrobium parvum]